LHPGLGRPAGSRIARFPLSVSLFWTVSKSELEFSTSVVKGVHQ
jgi:hypothetical protein